MRSIQMRFEYRYLIKGFSAFCIFHIFIITMLSLDHFCCWNKIQSKRLTIPRLVMCSASALV